MRDLLIVHYENTTAKANDTIPFTTNATVSDTFTILNTLQLPVRMTAVSGGDLLDPRIPDGGVVLPPGKPNRSYTANAAGKVKLHLVPIREGDKAGEIKPAIVGDPEIIISGGEPQPK
jgi:hypothetical protein